MFRVKWRIEILSRRISSEKYVHLCHDASGTFLLSEFLTDTPQVPTEWIDESWVHLNVGPMCSPVGLWSISV